MDNSLSFLFGNATTTAKVVDEPPPAENDASNTLQLFPCSYWFDNLGFITEGKLAVVLIIPSSWGSQRALR